MLKKNLMLFLIGGVLTLFVTVGLHAATDVKDVIPMKNAAYEKHTKGIVDFTHKKHAEDYAKTHPELYKNGCGECHHDDKGKPLSDLKAGDDVQSCVACHKDTGKLPKGEKLAKPEKIKRFHKEALHANCRGCHKAFNKKMGYKKSDAKAAPTDCKTCHPKKKK